MKAPLVILYFSFFFMKHKPDIDKHNDPTVFPFSLTELLIAIH